MPDPVTAPAQTAKTTEDSLEPQFDEGSTDAFEPEVVEAEKEKATPAETPEDDSFEESKKFEDPDFVDTVEEVGKEKSKETPAKEAAEKIKDGEPPPKSEQPKSLKIKIGEEEKEVGVEELEKGYNLALQLQDKAEDVLQLHESAMKTLKSLADNPIGTLMDVFTGLLGDREKAFVHVAKLGDAIVKQALEYEGMGEREQKSIWIEDENRRLKGEREKDENRRKEEEKSKADLERSQKISIEITHALKAAGLPVDQWHIGMTAGFMNSKTDAKTAVAQLQKRIDELIKAAKEREKSHSIATVKSEKSKIENTSQETNRKQPFKYKVVSSVKEN